MSHHCGLSHAATELLHFSAPKPAKLWVKSVVTLTFGLYPPSSAPQKAGKENNEEYVASHASPVLCWPWVCVQPWGALEPSKSTTMDQNRTISWCLIHLCAEIGCGVAGNTEGALQGLFWHHPGGWRCSGLFLGCNKYKQDSLLPQAHTAGF